MFTKNEAGRGMGVFRGPFCPSPLTTTINGGRLLPVISPTTVKTVLKPPNAETETVLSVSDGTMKMDLYFLAQCSCSSRFGSGMGLHISVFTVTKNEAGEAMGVSQGPFCPSPLTTTFSGGHLLPVISPTTVKTALKLSSARNLTVLSVSLSCDCGTLQSAHIVIFLPHKLY